jgi:hypothetical protein
MIEFVIKKNFYYYNFYNLNIKILTLISSEIIQLVRKHMNFLKNI